MTTNIGTDKTLADPAARWPPGLLNAAVIVGSLRLYSTLTPEGSIMDRSVRSGSNPANNYGEQEAWRGWSGVALTGCLRYV